MNSPRYKQSAPPRTHKPLQKNQTAKAVFVCLAANSIRCDALTQFLIPFLSRIHVNSSALIAELRSIKNDRFVERSFFLLHFNYSRFLAGTGFCEVCCAPGFANAVRCKTFSACSYCGSWSVPISFGLVAKNFC